MSLAFYKVNINEGNFGQRAARQEAELGEFFYEMIEPKLPGSLEGNLELVEQKKAFQKPGTARKQFWKKQVLLHNMGLRLFDEDDNLSFFTHLKKQDQRVVLRDVQDPSIRDYLNAKKNDFLNNPQLDSLFSNDSKPMMQALYETLWFDSGMDHGYYGQPYQYSVRTMEALLKANKLQSGPLALILGINHRSIDTGEPLSSDAFIRALQAKNLSGDQAFKTIRYMAAVDHGYTQARRTFQQNQATIQALGSQYTASEKLAIGSVSWEMPSSPIDNIINYNHLKDNGHMYVRKTQKDLTSAQARGKLSDADLADWDQSIRSDIREFEFEYLGTFQDLEKPAYDRFVFQFGLFHQTSGGDPQPYYQLYTEKDGVREKFSIPQSNGLSRDRRAVNFKRVIDALGSRVVDRVTGVQFLVNQSVQYLNNQYLNNPPTASDTHAAIQALQTFAQSRTADLKTYLTQAYNLYSKAQQLLPDVGTRVSSIQDDKTRVWGDLYPIITLYRVLLNSLGFVDTSQFPEENRDKILKVLETNSIIAKVDNHYMLIKTGTVAKQKFSDLGDSYEDVYETLIEKGILHRIDDNNARLAIPKEELHDRLNFLTQDQKNKVLPILQQSQIDAPITANDLIDSEDNFSQHLDSVVEALKDRIYPSIFLDQKTVFEDNGHYVVGNAHVQSVYQNASLLAELQEQTQTLKKTMRNDSLLMTIQNKQITSRQARKAANYSQAYESWRSDVEARKLQERRKNA